MFGQEKHSLILMGGRSTKVLYLLPTVFAYYDSAVSLLECILLVVKKAQSKPESELEFNHAFTMPRLALDDL